MLEEKILKLTREISELIQEICLKSVNRKSTQALAEYTFELNALDEQEKSLEEMLNALDGKYAEKVRLLRLQQYNETQELRSRILEVHEQMQSLEDSYAAEDLKIKTVYNNITKGI